MMMLNNIHIWVIRSEPECFLGEEKMVYTRKNLGFGLDFHRKSLQVIQLDWNTVEPHFLYFIKSNLPSYGECVNDESIKRFDVPRHPDESLHNIENQIMSS